MKQFYFNKSKGLLKFSRSSRISRFYIALGFFVLRIEIFLIFCSPEKIAYSLWFNRYAELHRINFWEWSWIFSLLNTHALVHEILKLKLLMRRIIAMFPPIFLLTFSIFNYIHLDAIMAIGVFRIDIRGFCICIITWHFLEL